jgi:NADH:ubiquinone oxidoreductase subunit K
MTRVLAFLRSPRLLFANGILMMLLAGALVIAASVGAPKSATGMVLVLLFIGILLTTVTAVGLGVQMHWQRRQNKTNRVERL